MPLYEEHAGCLTWWELLALVGHEAAYRRPQPGRVAGSRTAGREAWLAALAKEARRVRDAAQSLSGLDALTEEALRHRYDAHLAHLRGNEFSGSRQYLADLAGKALLHSLGAHLRALGARRLTQDDLQDALVVGLAAAYTPDLFIPDDFGALAQRLRDLAG